MNHLKIIFTVQRGFVSNVYEAVHRSNIYTFISNNIDKNFSSINYILYNLIEVQNV